ncbi:MAG: right-handed parallel beta-helix repeat-containing protein, partial [Patescibacteria group bacterium]
PLPTSADTVISSPISIDTVWTASSSPYIIDSSFLILAGVTLTIEPGVVVKAKITGLEGPNIRGTLVARGTNEAPIIFTSFNDSEAGEWQGLYFKEGSVGDFEHIILRYSGYGGYGYGNFVGIENDGGALNIKNSHIHDNYKILFDWGTGYYTAGIGIRNKGELSMSDSTVGQHLYGILSETGTTTIINNIFQNNSGQGIDMRGPEPLTLLNNVFVGNKKTAYIDASKHFIHSGNTSADLTKKGFEMTGVLIQDITLHSADLPIIISGGLTIPVGQTLTIAPGTVIKLDSWPSFGSITAQGALKSLGTKDQPIYFTSIKDDAIGGDTNGDATTTSPAVKDWNAIYLENGSKADFSHTIIRYGGFNYNGEYLPGVAAAIYDRGAELQISNSFFGHNFGAALFKDAGNALIKESEFADNTYGLQFRGGQATVSKSSLHGHNDQAIYNQSGLNAYGSPPGPVQIIDARENWWSSPDGPRDISTSTPTGNGDRVSQNVLYIPFLTEPPCAGALPQEVNPACGELVEPVIIIPG